MEAQMTLGAKTMATADTVEKNRQDRATFVREWERLSMPGDVLATTLDKLPVCGRFVTVMDTLGERTEYETEIANRVLRDFGTGDGANDTRHRAIMDAMRASDAAYAIG